MYMHKKGNKLDPANYRAIALLSIPGKVFCRMVLSRIQESIDSHLTEEQCGFRSARGSTDATFTVRQLFEKSKERLTPIHWNFVDFHDFKAAFDTIWREALWKCLRSTGADIRFLWSLSSTCTTNPNAQSVLKVLGKSVGG